MYIKSEAEAPEGDVAEVEGEAAPASVPEGGEGPVTTPLQTHNQRRSRLKPPCRDGHSEVTKS